MIVKLGTEYLDDREAEIYMINGTCTQDGIVKQVGAKNTDLGVVSVAAGTNREHGTVFVTVNFWGKNAHLAASFSKGDRILAIGKMTSNKSNGKIYLTLNTDFTTREYIQNVDHTGEFEPDGNDPMLSDGGTLPF